MKWIDYYLDGFGFKDRQDYITTTFGYMLQKSTITWSLIFGFAKTLIQDLFGFDYMVLLAFVFLNILEYKSGVAASKKNGQPFQSRKVGRMLLKVGTYMMIIFILNTFEKRLKMPEVMGFELDPFTLLYFAFLFGVIIQLLKSLFENWEQLGYKEARGALGFIVRKYNKFFESDESGNNSNR